MKIENKVALVTGAASGIGQAVAAELVKRRAESLSWSTAATRSSASPRR